MNDFNLIDELYIQCLETDLNNARDIIQKLCNVLYPFDSPTIEKLKDEANYFLNKPKCVRHYL